MFCEINYFIYRVVIWISLLVSCIGKCVTLSLKESNYLFSTFLAHHSRLSWSFFGMQQQPLHCLHGWGVRILGCWKITLLGNLYYFVCNSGGIAMCPRAACSQCTESGIRFTEAIEKSALEYRFPTVTLNAWVTKPCFFWGDSESVLLSCTYFRHLPTKPIKVVYVDITFYSLNFHFF